ILSAYSGMYDNRTRPESIRGSCQGGRMGGSTELAQRLRQAREQVALTQQQVADWLGVRRPAVAEIEAGTRAVKSDELVRLAVLYGRSLSWLVEGEVGPEEQIAAALFRTADHADPTLRREAARLAKRCAVVLDLEREIT